MKYLQSNWIVHNNRQYLCKSFRLLKVKKLVCNSLPSQNNHEMNETGDI